ncbi:MAG: DUF368 domain-containing protein, partial [Bacteroidia bacterium]
MRQYISLFLNGLAMGAANVIPGVSGGTIALITGIYERLIQAVKSIDMAAIKLLLKGKVKEFWTHIDGTFLTLIFSGVGVSLISLAKLFKFMMENEVYAVWLMAFFFGLIIMSIFSVGRTVSKWSAVPIVALLIGLAVAVSIALLTPASENEAIWYLMICGVVAMCSMILPGLSGSFVLIIMGNYKLIMLDAVSELNIKILIPVAIGAIGGLLAFSRILAWVFERYRDVTIASMTGFILGSLAIIWPWKNEVPLRDEAGEVILKRGKEIVSGFEWFMPDFGDNNTLIAVACALVGGIALWGLEKSASGLAK